MQVKTIIKLKLALISTKYIGAMHNLKDKYHISAEDRIQKVNDIYHY